MEGKISLHELVSDLLWWLWMEVNGAWNQPFWILFVYLYGIVYIMEKVNLFIATPFLSHKVVIAGFACCVGSWFCFSVMPQYGHQKTSYPKSWVAEEISVRGVHLTSPRTPTQQRQVLFATNVLLSSSALWPALTLYFLSLFLPRV